MTGANRLRELLARPGMVDAIGTHDVHSARLVEEAGFEAVYAGGAAVGASEFGLPDIGILGVDHFIDHARRVVDAVDIPVIVDMDDGGGNPLRVRRTVRLAEQAGVAALHIEDTDFTGGKHFAGADGLALDQDRLVPIKSFVESVRAAFDARRDPDTVIIARTDAAKSSIEDAVTRARAYAEAGADLAFLCWLREEDVAAVAAAIPVPLMFLAHDPSKATRDQLERDGVKIMFRPSFTASPAFLAVQAALRELAERGELQDFRRPTFADRSQAVRSFEWADWAKRYGMSGESQ